MNGMKKINQYLKLLDKCISVAEILVLLVERYVLKLVDAVGSMSNIIF